MINNIIYGHKYYESSIIFFIQVYNDLLVNICIVLSFLRGLLNIT